MNLSATILGSTAVEALKKTAAAPVLQIGSDKLTRGDLAKVSCYNFLAAKVLSRILNDELQVKNLRDVYENVPPSALALPGLGVICLACLGAAFEAKGVGGDTPLEAYVSRHAEKADDGDPYITTFYTMKKHHADEVSQERKDAKARKDSRRRKAHGLRVARFTQRQAKA
jgi:hypothetical protein